jgi:hypothetical protein
MNGLTEAFLLEIIKGAMPGGKAVKPAAKSQDMQARILLDSCAKFAERFDKKPGMLLMAKHGVCSGYNFVGTSLAVISKVFNPPLKHKELNGSSTHFGRDLDIAVLVIDGEGDIIEYAVDSRFFEPYTGEVA